MVSSQISEIALVSLVITVSSPYTKLSKDHINSLNRKCPFFGGDSIQPSLKYQYISALPTMPDSLLITKYSHKRIEHAEIILDCTQHPLLYSCVGRIPGKQEKLGKQMYLRNIPYGILQQTEQGAYFSLRTLKTATPNYLVVGDYATALLNRQTLRSCSAVKSHCDDGACITLSGSSPTPLFIMGDSL